MHTQLIIRQFCWLLLIPLLAGCGAATVTPLPVAATPVSRDAFASQVVATVVAQITQTAYVTPTATWRPTETPNPTYTPAPVYSRDGKRKVSTIGGNLYLQDGLGENVQLTRDNVSHDPIFSDDGQKIVFYHDSDISFYVIDARDKQMRQIIDVRALSPQYGVKIKALTFLKNTHILVFNLYRCEERLGPYKPVGCFVSTYSVNVDSGTPEEIGQAVSGTRFDDSNFEISPDQKYISIAGSGHINIFSFSAGHFDLAYFDAFAYSMTDPNEFLPYQYWLPDSSGLLIVSARAGTFNSPPDPPDAYDVFRYLLGQKPVQIDGIQPYLGYIWRMGCTVSVSPDRNWLFFRNQSMRLGNLKDGKVIQSYDLDDLPCGAIAWSPDSKHFGISNLRYGRVGSVDGSSLTTLPGFFNRWIDATHYSYIVGNNTMDFKEYVAEIGGDSVLVLTPTPTPTPQ